MAIPSWTSNEGLVYLAAGRLSAARAAIEALAPPEWGTATEVNMNRMFTLAEVAARCGDRNLLQDMVSGAHGAYAEGSPLVSRGAAYVLGLAAWHRDDVAEAVRWLSSDAPMLVTPLFGNQYDQLILTARVAAAAGDAGLRARMLDCVTLLEREQPPVVMVAAITDYLCGILERDSERLLAAANSLQSLGWPLLYADAVEQAGEEFVRTGQRDGAVEQLNAAFDTYRSHGALADARRVERPLRRLGVERRISSAERPRTGWNSLTQSELRVVHLIADGATNARVAGQLDLSPHTVKTHVRNAFTKLGINSRAELRRLMRG